MAEVRRLGALARDALHLRLAALHLSCVAANGGPWIGMAEFGYEHILRAASLRETRRICVAQPVLRHLAYANTLLVVSALACTAAYGSAVH